MRIPAILSMLFMLLFATNAHHTLLIGAGPYIQTQPYKNTSAKVTPSPVIFYDNHIFYIRWSRVGVYVGGAVHNDYSWGLSLATQPQPYGYSASNSNDLKGMKSKRSTLVAGPSFDMTYKDYFLNIVLFYDILHENNAYMSHLQIGKKLTFGKFLLFPSLLAIYYGNRFNNYYYGVSHNETTPLRPYYRAKGGFNYAFETYIQYPITQRYSLLINLRAEYLNQNIQHSPIVASHYIYSSLLSLLYKYPF